MLFTSSVLTLRYPRNISYEFNVPFGGIHKLVPTIFAYGSGSSNGVVAKLWNHVTSAWETIGSNTAEAMPDTPIAADFTTDPVNYVDENNKAYILVRAVSSDTSTTAMLYADYIKLDVVPAPTIRGVALSPPSPVKAETVEFAVVFSEQMDTTVAPTVTFGMNAPLYPTTLLHPKTGAGYSNGYLDSNPRRWFGAFTFTDIMPNGTYTLSISSAENLAGVPMATDTSFTFGLDTAPPNEPAHVQSTSHIPNITSLDSEIVMMWTPTFDSTGGIGLDGYSYTFDNSAVGSCDREKDIEATTIRVTSPPLADGTWYFLHLRSG